MIDDATLGGYFTRHSRPPAFEGPDGAAYSVAVYVDDAPAADGRYGGALLFVKWTPSGDQPAGHVESEYLVYSPTAVEAEKAVRSLTLHQVKEQLDLAVARSRALPDWS